MNGGIYITQEELNRADVFTQISQKRLSQSKAAEILGFSIRQIQHVLEHDSEDTWEKHLAESMRGREFIAYLEVLAKTDY